ncbi:MAG: monooxygenase FAD-binding protein [Bacilli bacterium]|nr:monooxygenase FAD-binding protein [Bacilli bacterium]
MSNVLKLHKHAIVIGGSMSGMLAAKVLSGHFEKVTILEKDNIPEHPVYRKGVPHDRQAHIMNMKGEMIISKYFPGFYEEINKEIFKFGTKDLCFFHYGSWKLRCKTKVTNHFMSRPFLEHHIRRRLLQLSNIFFMQKYEVNELIIDRKKNEVLGVLLKNQQGAFEKLHADLVIDASGRNTKVPGWLESEGYPKINEEKLEIDIGYSSQVFPRSQEYDFSVMSIYPKAPNGTKMGVIYPIEGNRWLVGIVGLLGNYPAHTNEGFLEFVKSLDRPDIYNIIRNQSPLSSVSTHRFPSNLRRYYERSSKLPINLVVVGDALCSFNPIYAQGMCVAAMESELLDELLFRKSTFRNFSDYYFKKVSKIIDVAWLASVSEDLRYPNITGRRSLKIKFLNWYMAQIFELASIDSRICSTFYEVQSFIKKPAHLFAFSILYKVFKHSMGVDSYKPVLERPKQNMEDNE